MSGRWGERQNSHGLSRVLQGESPRHSSDTLGHLSHVSPSVINTSPSHAGAEDRRTDPGTSWCLPGGGSEDSSAGGRASDQCPSCFSTYPQPAQSSGAAVLRRDSPGQGGEDKPPSDNIHGSASPSLRCEPGPAASPCAGQEAHQDLVSFGGRRAPSSAPHSPEHPAPTARNGES